MWKPMFNIRHVGMPLTAVRRYVKDAKPVDLSYIEDLPEHEYPRKRFTETTVYGWGLSDHGALGHYIQKKKKMKDKRDPRFKRFIRPFRMLFGEQNKVRDVAAGFGFSLFSVKSKDQNKIYGTGLNTDSQIGYHEVRRESPLETILSPVPIYLGLKNPATTKVIGLSAGRAHTVVVTDSEGVFTLGNNAYGQCGRLIVEKEQYYGSRLVHNIPSLGREKIESVECGQDHTLFVTESGNVYSCGWGADGQTGLGHFNVEYQPTRILGDIEGEKIVKVSSKSDSVLAINDKGDVFGWGNSEYSQLFGKSETLQQINRPIHLKKCQGFGKIVDVACGGSFCMMLNEAGDVFTWGYGILGRGPNVSHCWNPELVPPILFGRNDFQRDSTVKSVFCGLAFCAAVTNYGHLYTWGKNKGGCLGLALIIDQYFPLRVYINAVVKKLALGVDHSVAICHPL